MKKDAIATKNITISIAMCTYNGAKFIDEQLQTIIDQDYPLHEIIVVDDQSTDNTYNILKVWESKYPNLFKIYSNENNLGFDKNFEKAVSLCTGELIAIADQDDIWIKNKLTILSDCFSNPKVMLAHGASLTLKKGKLHHFSGQLKRYKLLDGSDTRKLFLMNQLSGHNIIFRKSLLSTALPIPLNMPYDWWFALNATARGEIKAVQKYLVHHRKHGDNAFFSKKRKKNILTLQNRLILFTNIIGLNKESCIFLNQFIQKIKVQETLKSSKTNWSLFTFLFKNRKIFFGHKKRICPTFTSFIDSLKFSK